MTGKETYEAYEIIYDIPASKHIYTPDFILPNGIIVEAKGIFELKDRQKHLWIKQQYPHLDIRFVFSNPKNTLYKGSPTTYAKWCEKNGFKWAHKLIPHQWFLEETKNTNGLRKKKKRKKENK